MRQFVSPMLVVGAFGLASPVFADSTADLTVAKGSVATVELVVEISTSFGTDTDSGSVQPSWTRTFRRS